VYLFKRFGARCRRLLEKTPLPRLLLASGSFVDNILQRLDSAPAKDAASVPHDKLCAMYDKGRINMNQVIDTLTTPEDLAAQSSGSLKFNFSQRVH
jgi:hypothetical protein